MFDAAGRARCGPFAPWYCAWRARTTAGGCRRLQGELLTLGIKVAPSTVWEILREAGVDPAATTWADFLRSHAHALLAADFIETVA